MSTTNTESEISGKAAKLIERDQSEGSDFGGQELRETFHLADVFIDGISKSEMNAKLERFVFALFGRTDIAPTKDEYGMYAAKSASLRSADLSRQIGAAVFSSDGELITQGCNEVPRARGGTYWDMETPDFRDVRIGHDPNDDFKIELLRDLFERLKSHGFLSDKALALGTPLQIVNSVSEKATRIENDETRDGALVGAAILDLTEFGRVVHAEMSAICDAARLGRSLKGATLFCTTFPCHNCTKHIIASGLRRVVFMEPYPKSKAKELHRHEIELEGNSDSKVSFIPFMGIPPVAGQRRAMSTLRASSSLMRATETSDRSLIFRSVICVGDQEFVADVLRLVAYIEERFMTIGEHYSTE